MVASHTMCSIIRGMVVQGPNKQNDVVNQILKKAAE